MASTGQAVPPLLRTVWVRVDTGAGAVAELSSRTRERVLLRTHLQLDGQLVRAGDTVTVPGVGIGGAMGTASVIRVSSNASGAPAAKGKGSTQPPSVGRMTARTEVHIEKTRAASPGYISCIAKMKILTARLFRGSSDEAFLRAERL